MADRKLRVMPVIEVPPSDASIMRPTNPGAIPLFTGTGPESLLCGRCDAVLAKNMHPGQLRDLFIVCPHCGGMNDVNP
jgi:hypothetical protein